ncbi:MAG: hypothetical protein DLM65_08610 [Candidatus Aeolococcus gillhamiae]|uniref:Uncharacterized protein n=1 Tax=Candidatus Aeolococcus gillhamiae TaxID=3127015 RepID=A0A2W6A4H5_9BACT|nr:MAG: hypothetical protein DLM65_08610 [Candidatus Dormibacter sp. RRmetagenome_bin12]
MSTGRPGTALEEAQRLLVDHGRWTTDGGAYLESDNVIVVIHPVHDDARDGAVDVVVTVRPRHGRSQPGTSIQLEGTGAPSVSVPLNRRGQAVFRRLAAGEWSARLMPGDMIASPPAEPSGQVIALHRITRRLALAAGDEQRDIRHTWTSADGGLVTEIVETDEAHLVVRISSSAPPSAPAVVRIRWAVVVSETTDRAKTLVVPLAPGDDGAVVTAKYDLGLVDQAQAVDIGPAEWADPSELTAELVFEAFDLALFGSARRAWEQLAGADVCAAVVQAALRTALEG